MYDKLTPEQKKLKKSSIEKYKDVKVILHLNK